MASRSTPSASARAPRISARSRPAPTPAAWSASTLKLQSLLRREVSDFGGRLLAEPGGRVGRRAAGRQIAGDERFLFMVQGPADGWKGEIVPRDLIPAEQPDFEALGPGHHRLVEQPRAVDQLHLAD